MMNDLIAPYCKVKITDSHYTYSDLSNHKKIIKIPSDNVGKLMIDYAKSSSLVEAGDLEPMTLAEIVTGEYMPVVYDFRFRFPYYQVGDLLYKDNFLPSISAEINNLIKDEQNNTICCTFKSEIWKEENVTKLDVRFLFPFTRISTEKKNGELRELLVKSLKDRGLLKLLSSSPIGEWDSIIERGNIIPMFGSVYQIGDNVMQFHSIENNGAKLHISDVFSISDSSLIKI